MFYVLVCCIFCHVLKLVYSYFVSLSDIYLFKKLSLQYLYKT